MHEAGILKEVKAVHGSEVVIVGDQSTDKRQKVGKPSTRKRQLAFKNDSELCALGEGGSKTIFSH